MFRSICQIPLLMVVLLALTAVSCRQSPNNNDPNSQSIPITDNNDDLWPDGWDDASGNVGNPDYAIQFDPQAGYNEPGSIRLESLVDSPQHAAIVGRKLKRDYRGERIRLSGYIKTEDVNQIASLWMRVDGVGRANVLAFDNMGY
jgi:hypothetical protein